MEEVKNKKDMLPKWELPKGTNMMNTKIEDAPSGENRNHIPGWSFINTEELS